MHRVAGNNFCAEQVQSNGAQQVRHQANFGASSLPNEILELIFKYTEVADRKSIISVCKRWRDICATEKFAIDQVFSLNKYLESWNPVTTTSTLAPRTFPHVKFSNTLKKLDRRKNKVFMEFLKEFGRHIKYLEICDGNYANQSSIALSEVILNFCTGCETLKFPAIEFCFFLKPPSGLSRLIIKESRGSIEEVFMDTVNSLQRQTSLTITVENLQIWRADMDDIYQFDGLLDEYYFVDIHNDVVNFIRKSIPSSSCAVARNFPLHKTLTLSDLKYAKCYNFDVLQLSNLENLGLQIRESCFQGHDKGLKSLKALYLIMYSEKNLCKLCLRGQLQISTRLTSLFLDVTELQTSVIETVAKYGKALKHLEFSYGILTVDKPLHNALHGFEKLVSVTIKLNIYRGIDNKGNKILNINPLKLMLTWISHQNVNLRVFKFTGLTQSSFEQFDWKCDCDCERVDNVSSSLRSLCLEIDYLTKDNLEKICKMVPNLIRLILILKNLSKEPDGVFNAEFIQVLKENCRELVQFEYDFHTEMGLKRKRGTMSYKLPTWIKKMYKDFHQQIYIKRTRNNFSAELGMMKF